LVGVVAPGRAAPISGPLAPTLLQAKSEKSAPGDAQERQADAVAAAVVRSSAPASAIESRGSASGEGLLAPALRAPVEAHLNVDLSSVRVHTGPEATRVARAVQARAFTVGQDIVFGKDQFRPASLAGRRLIAHELVHVAQQGG
jgi:hypothetical protein